MSNRLFKTILNNQRFILFDYGIVDKLPEISDKTVSGFCSLNGIYYIYQKGRDKWMPLTSESFIDFKYLQTDEDDSKFWIDEFTDDFLISDNQQLLIDVVKIKEAAKGNLFVYQHKQNKLLRFSVFRKNIGSYQFVESDQSIEYYQPIDIPYYNIGDNITLFDFSFKEFQSDQDKINLNDFRLFFD